MGGRQVHAHGRPGDRRVDASSDAVPSDDASEARFCPKQPGPERPAGRPCTIGAFPARRRQGFFFLGQILARARVARRRGGDETVEKTFDSPEKPGRIGRRLGLEAFVAIGCWTLVFVKDRRSAKKTAN